MSKQKSKKYSLKQGLPPGSLVHTGNAYEKEMNFHLFVFDKDEFFEKTSDNIDNILNFIKPDKTNWIKITGLHDINAVEKTGTLFNIHPLILEDVLNTHHLPKAEDYNEHLFFTSKQLIYQSEQEYLDKRQVSFILGSHYLISFEEYKSDIFSPVIERIVNKKGKVRWMQSDYLLYALIDVLVDAYLHIIDVMEEDIEKIEEELLNQHSKLIVSKIMLKRKQQLSFKKTILPMLEESRRLRNMDTALINDKTHIYLQDIIDHLIQITQNQDSFREIVSNLMDMYLANNDIQMNEVMKRLTVVATIFIPLTFIVGIYGMNFQNMPELGWKHGYYIIWGVMILIAVFMTIYLKKRKWF